MFTFPYLHVTVPQHTYVKPLISYNVNDILPVVVQQGRRGKTKRERGAKVKKNKENIIKSG